MISEIPTQSRRIEHFIGTVVFVIVAACISALILTAPVWSADDLTLPAASAAASGTPSAELAPPAPLAGQSDDR